MLIDLDKLRQLDYDPSSQVARASPSFSGRQVNHLLSQHGVWFPGGHCPDVGIGGFLLQGGSGWNNRNYGVCSASLSYENFGLIDSNYASGHVPWLIISMS